MYDALDIASYIIIYCDKNDYIISNLKLQKLLYFVQAAFLIKNNKPCFQNKIEAWGFGPVVPTVYEQYAEYGSGNIPTIKSFFLLDKKDLWNTKKNNFKEEDIFALDKELINSVIEKYKNFSSTDLVALTQRQSPWLDAYSDFRKNEITNDSLIKFFIG